MIESRISARLTTGAGCEGTARERMPSAEGPRTRPRRSKSERTSSVPWCIAAPFRKQKAFPENFRPPTPRLLCSMTSASTPRLERTRRTQSKHASRLYETRGWMKAKFRLPAS